MKSPLRTLAAALFCSFPLALPSCYGTPPSSLRMPTPSLRDGVQVVVTGLQGTWTRASGLIGTVQNTTSGTIPRFYMRFDAYGYKGDRVGRASAEVLNLAPSEVRTFTAHFPPPTLDGLHEIRIASAHR